MAWHWHKLYDQTDHMFRNYWTIAWRTLLRNKVFSLLNILGLALGLTCSLLILLWVQDERSVNATHVHGDRLFQLYERTISDGSVDGDYDTPALLAEELKKDFPEIQYAVSTEWDDSSTFRTEDKTLRANGGFAGRDFFKVFSFRLLAGDAGSALNGPRDIAISQKMAVSLFGSTQAAMGKILRRDSSDQWKDFMVSAVFEEPVHSSLSFDFILNWKQYAVEAPGMLRWENSGPRTMIVLRESARPDQVRAKIRGFLDQFELRHIPGHRTELGMQRFDETWLHSRFENGDPAGGRIAYVRLFTLVAIFILLIACINFMNLTTARSMKRAREIGVRKVIGARRSSLIGQFLGEAVLLATGAALLSLCLLHAVLPVFNDITGKHILLPLGSWSFWGQWMGITLLTGLLAGSYPALFLSAFQPAKVLKGKLHPASGGVLLRKGLVVLQFTLSTILIIGTLVVAKQIGYLQTTDIGFNRENLLYIPREGRLEQEYTLFREKALQIPGVRMVAWTISDPTSLDNGTINFSWDGKPANYVPNVVHAAVDYDYLRTMGVHLKAGRDFSRDFPADTNNYILNESAVATTGLKDPIGSNLTFWGRKGRIIGVVRDFHYKSLHDPVKPLILRLRPAGVTGCILVRIAPSQTPVALAGLQSLWRQLNPGFPFTWKFSDEDYQKFYLGEQVVKQLSQGFAILAIVISCLGLLGLALFTAEQRTKEIGIRKVLGAEVGQLFTLLSKDFLALVLLAFLIAAPLAWWAMDRWLADYSAHIPFPVAVFPISGLLALGIALLTVAGQSLRAARANPVDSLHAD